MRQLAELACVETWMGRFGATSRQSWNTPKEVFDDAYIFLMLQFAAIPFTIAYNLLSGQIMIDNRKLMFGRKMKGR